MFDDRSWDTRSYDQRSWFGLGVTPPLPEDERQLYPGAFAAIGSTDGVLRLRRKKKARERDLLFLGH